MATFDRRLPRAGYPRSLDQLRKFTGKDSALYEFLKYGAFKDVVFLFDDFLGDTIDTNLYAVANSGGAGAASFAISVAANGKIRATSGTTDNGSCSLVGPLIYAGDNNAGMEIRFKSDVVDAGGGGVHFEVGFIDAVPGSNTGGVNDIDTPTAYMGDGAVLAMDTDQTLKTMAFVTEGSTTGQDPAKTNVAAPAPTAPTADTYITVRIQLIGNNAYCWVNGILVASHNTDADGALEGGTLLAPWVYVQTRSTTAVNFDVDYLAIWAERA